MKILVNILVCMFLIFLAAPTIVSLIEDEADISMVYSLTEEEIQKELKEVKAHCSISFEYACPQAAKKSTLIPTQYLRGHSGVFEEIFSPPPEII